MTNLLLLLSAMFSALIGAGPAVRVAQTPVAVASAASGQAASVAVRSVTARPLQAVARMAAFLWLGAIILPFAPVSVPAWKMRRRE